MKHKKLFKFLMIFIIYLIFCIFIYVSDSFIVANAAEIIDPVPHGEGNYYHYYMYDLDTVTYKNAHSLSPIKGEYDIYTKQTLSPNVQRLPLVNKEMADMIYHHSFESTDGWYHGYFPYSLTLTFKNELDVNDRKWYDGGPFYVEGIFRVKYYYPILDRNRLEHTKYFSFSKLYEDGHLGISYKVGKNQKKDLDFESLYRVPCSDLPNDIYSNICITREYVDDTQIDVYNEFWSFRLPFTHLLELGDGVNPDGETFSLNFDFSTSYNSNPYVDDWYDKFKDMRLNDMLYDNIKDYDKLNYSPTIEFLQLDYTNKYHNYLTLKDNDIGDKIQEELYNTRENDFNFDQDISTLPGSDKPKTIWDKILDFILGLFVPGSDYFKYLYDKIQSKFETKFSLFTYPISVVTDIVGRFKDLEETDIKNLTISIPEYKIPGFNIPIIRAQTFSFNTVLNEPHIKSLWYLYLDFVDVILIFAFLNLAYNKLMSFLEGVQVGNTEIYTNDNDTYTYTEHYDNQKGEWFGGSITHTKSTNERVRKRVK